MSCDTPWFVFVFCQLCPRSMGQPHVWTLRSRRGDTSRDPAFHPTKNSKKSNSPLQIFSPFTAEIRLGASSRAWVAIIRNSFNMRCRKVSGRRREILIPISDWVANGGGVHYVNLYSEDGCIICSYNGHTCFLPATGLGHTLYWMFAELWSSNSGGRQICTVISRDRQSLCLGSIMSSDRVSYDV